MTADSLAESVQFASNIEQAKVLDRIVQRELSESRAKDDIARYLSLQEGRFFNSIVVAAWDGKPTFFEVNLADDERFRIVADRRFEQSFGVLRFDGSQRYYALDGQHRLRAIRALVHRETEYAVPAGFGAEEFPVIIVVPNEGERFETFLPRYRRLFSNLNRYAKAMDPATIVAMDEDDGIAIVTRRLVAEHEFFWWESGEASRIKVQKGKAISENENCLFTLFGLYEINGDLLWSAAREREKQITLKDWKRERPTDQEIDSLFAELRETWDAILNELPELRTDTTTNFRSKRGDDFERDGKVVVNHLLFRPIGQRLLAKCVRQMLDNNMAERDAKRTLRGLNGIEWRLYKAPWRHLLTRFDAESDAWVMRTEKEAQSVAQDILNFITGNDCLDEEALEGLREKWTGVLVNPDPGYVDSGWSTVLKLAHDFIRCRSA